MLEGMQLIQRVVRPPEVSKSTAAIRDKTFFKMTGAYTHLNASPLLVPIPCLDGHIITTGEHDARGGVNGQASDVVWVRLKSSDLFVGIVVEDAKLEVVGARDEPVLARNEADAANGDLRDLECLDQRAGVMVVDVDRAVVEAGEDPGLGGVEVDALDAV